MKILIFKIPTLFSKIVPNFWRRNFPKTTIFAGQSNFILFGVIKPTTPPTASNNLLTNSSSQANQNKVKKAVKIKICQIVSHLLSRLAHSMER